MRVDTAAALDRSHKHMGSSLILTYGSCAATHPYHRHRYLCHLLDISAS